MTGELVLRGTYVSMVFLEPQAGNILGAVAESSVVSPSGCYYVYLWYSCPHDLEFQWSDKLLAYTALTQATATSHLGFEGASHLEETAMTGCPQGRDQETDT